MGIPPTRKKTTEAHSSAASKEPRECAGTWQENGGNVQERSKKMAGMCRNVADKITAGMYKRVAGKEMTELYKSGMGQSTR